MTIDTDKATAFFQKVAPSLKSIAIWRNAPLGFNAFSLVSDFYYRETFHSDIIGSILDPASPHGEGALFLRLFVEFLAEEAERTLKEPGAKLNGDVPGLLRGLVIDASTTVEREKGKIDIKITASNGTVVIENKIYNAPDMERQLPRYVDLCREWNEKVIAVVYLTAAGEKAPDRSTYLPGDDEKVDPLLLRVAGHLKGQSNLVQGWIERCELAAKGFNTRSILDQYAELLRHQAGETMETSEIKNVLIAMAKNGIHYSELRDVVNNGMPQALADIVAETFLGRKEILKGTGVAYSTVAYLDLRDIDLPAGGEECFAIDVHCEDLTKKGISFFRRNGAPNSAYVDILKEYDPQFELGWSGRVVLPVDPDWAFGHIDEFLTKIRSLLDHLEKNRDRLKKICRGESGNADG